MCISTDQPPLRTASAVVITMSLTGCPAADRARADVEPSRLRDRHRSPRLLRMGAAAGLLALLATACKDGSPTQPLPEPCVLWAIGLPLTASAPAPERLHPALQDAATRSVAGLGTSAATQNLSAALAKLGTTMSGGDAAALCSAFNGVAVAIAAWDAAHAAGDPGRPDFTMIRQTLALYERSLREHRGL
jgi:hypothetical protein